jgi:competence protein ComEC
MVLRIDFAGRRLLFSGDIEAHAEQQLVAAGTDLRADILKVPHHGSRTSSSEALLQAVQPNVAMISAGAWNPFGHPHPEVVERLAKHAQRVIHLGEAGGTSIRLRADGEWLIESAAQHD